MKKDQKTLAIGFDLGGTNMAAALVDRQLKILESVEIDTPISSQESLLAAIDEMVAGLIAKAPAPVTAAGFGIPSMIDQKKGRAVMSVNVPLADFDFVEHMSARLGLPVFIDNDANVAALAEATAGAAKGAREVIMITVGTGIGGGIITGGKIYRGYTGSAAELGHMVIDVNGPRCQGNCSNFGCLETMASGSALTRYADAIAGEHPESSLARAAEAGKRLTGSLVGELARAGDAAAVSVMEKIGFYLGVGITNLVNIFNPEVFVVGGGISLAGDLIMKPAARVLAERGLRPNRDVVRLTTAQFGIDAGLIGAAVMAFTEVAAS